MPLDRPQEAVFRHIYGLHKAIRGSSHDLQPWRKLVNCLMMAAVDGQIFRFQILVQRGAFHYRHLMARHMIWRLLMVLNCRRVLRRNVLVQCPPKCSVDELDAPAYAENRLVGFYRLSEYDSFHDVPLFAAGNKPLQRFFMVYLRGHIVTTGEQKAIAHPGKLFQLGFIG